MSSAPLITIIVVAYNTRRFLARQMAALAAQTDQRFALVVLDNASRDEERPEAGELFAGAQLVQSAVNTGFAGGCNAAAAGVETEFIALLNPDAFPEPNWIAELLAAAVRWPEAAAFSSLQLADDSPSRLDGAGDVLFAAGLPYRALWGAPVVRIPREGETFSACGAAALYRTADFRAMGGFDERFFCYCEDVDLGFRLRLMGKATVFAPGARVRHVGGGASESNAFADYHGARNRLWLFCKCMPAPLIQILLAPHLIASLLVIGAHLFDGRWRAQLRGLRDGLAGLGPMLASRRTVQATRTARLSRIASALTWSPLAFLARAQKRG